MFTDLQLVNPNQDQPKRKYSRFFYRNPGNSEKYNNLSALCTNTNQGFRHRKNSFRFSIGARYRDKKPFTDTRKIKKKNQKSNHSTENS